MATFNWNGQTLELFSHRYNHAGINSRAVEVPIARWYVSRVLRDKGAQARILEVGNVLAHYGPLSWPVVDLRERGCVNVDVRRFRPLEPLDLLVSISTMEHVEGGPAHTFEHLRSFLAPGGVAVVTVPGNYRADLDADLRSGAIRADRCWPLAYAGGGWFECTLEAALTAGRRACAGRWCGGVVILEARV